jgi:Carboxypeptidase regulatory-like domain
MRTRRKTAGARRSEAPIRLILAVACILLCLPLPAAGGRPAKDQKRQDVVALIAGTVFQESGFLLRGAEVVISPDPEAKDDRKFKKVKVVSDNRGEFAVRVPAQPMRYTVSVSARGFRAQEKSVSIGGEERIDVFFRLAPEDK